ncbi:MAG: NAD(P)/FAD-dependent oxidoreductase [Proteobacteria bacterium]|nr:NAD(P)/FAD-dependent oxidoreductase [Pseudomonadota bacterium]
MTRSSKNFAIIGAGINGLVAANYLQRAGHKVTLLERSNRVGGACVSDTAEIEGIQQDYALGASVLGLMQGFVWQETGLADRLQSRAVTHPDLVWFPRDQHPTRLYGDADLAAQELANNWGERGDVPAYFADENRVVRFLQDGYRAGQPPSAANAEAVLGKDLATLWITGTARNLVDHYFTAERTKVNAAMDVSESGPVSIDEPYSAFIMPMMSSGSVFDGDSGFVKGGIWQVTHELGRINRSLGVDLVLNANIDEVDTRSGTIRFETASGSQVLHSEHVIFATDPQVAARLTGDAMLIDHTAQEQVLGTSGKLNLMFRNPVCWKDSKGEAESDTAFRYLFATDTLADFESATMAAADGEDFAPGYYQIYCEGASMRRMGIVESFDRLTVFLKNLALGKSGDQLRAVEDEVKAIILSHIENPEDCVWSRLLTPRDLQQTFGFPGGNIEHTMLVHEQAYDNRSYTTGPGRRFYQLGDIENASICGSSTYPCGSVAGTPAYMCVKELLRQL